MTPPPDPISRLYRQTRSQTRRFLGLRLLVELVCIPAALILIGGIFGRWLALHPAPRIVVLALAALAAAWVLWRHAIRPRLSGMLSERQAAELLRDRLPGIGGRLLNAWQLHHQLAGETPPDFSAAMARAYVEEVSGEATPLKLPRLYESRPLFRPLQLFGLLLLGLMIAYGVGPGRFQTSLAAMVDPDSLPAALAEDESGTPLLLSDLTVVYHYPAYTGRDSRVVPGADGTLAALRGTRAHLEARVVESAASMASEPALILLDPDGKTVRALATSYDPQTRRVAVDIPIEADGRYGLRLHSGRPLEQQPFATRVIRAEPDLPPTVAMNKPTEDLELQPEDLVEIEYELEDDYGLSGLVAKVEPVSESGAGMERMVPQRRYGGNPLDDDGRLTLSLDELELGPGDEAYLWLEALDNNTLDGPGLGAGPRIRIKVGSEKERMEELLAQLEQLLEENISTLAFDLTTPASARETGVALLDFHLDAQGRFVRLDELFGVAIDFMAETATGDLLTHTSLINLQDQTRSANREVVDATRVAFGPLASLLGPPAKDPLPSQRQILQRPLSRIHRQRLDAPQEARTVQLERNVLAIDDLIKKMRMEALLEESKDLLADQESLRDLLERYKETGDASLLEELLREIEKMQQKMAEILQKMAQLEQSLPDEFVNADALKDMEMMEGMDAMEALKQALKDGDMEDALVKAEDMLNALNEMLSAMEDAAQGFREDVGNELADQFGEVMDELQKLEKDQGDLNAQMEQMAQQARKEAMEQMEQEEQEDFFELQRERVRKILALLADAEGTLLDDDLFVAYLDDEQQVRLLNERLTYYGRYPGKQGEDSPDRGELMQQRNALQLRNAQRRMSALHSRQIYENLDYWRDNLNLLDQTLAGRDIEVSLATAESTLGVFDRSVGELERRTARLADPDTQRAAALAPARTDTSEARDINREIVEDLKKMREKLNRQLSPEQMAQLQQMRQKQQQLQGETESLHQKMDQLRKQTPMMGSGTCDKVGGAGKSMKQGAQAMQQGQMPQSMGNGRQAQQQLNEALSELQQMMEGGGQPQPGGGQAGNMPFPFMPMPGGQMPGPHPQMGKQDGGMRGTSVESVEIPERYLSPERFRKDLMERMKEAAPAEYEDMVKEYYRRLVE